MNTNFPFILFSLTQVFWNQHLNRLWTQNALSIGQYYLKLKTKKEQQAIPNSSTDWTHIWKPKCPTSFTWVCALELYMFGTWVSNWVRQASSKLIQEQEQEQETCIIKQQLQSGKNDGYRTVFWELQSRQQQLLAGGLNH